MSEQHQKPPINVDYFEDLTGDITKTAVDPIESVGERIRVLRQEKELSLEEVSRLTGFEIAFLEDLENNKVQPQLGTSIKLSRALDSAFGRIVSGVGNKLYSITRKNEEIPVSRSTSKKGKERSLLLHESCTGCKRPEHGGPHRQTERKSGRRGFHP